MRVRVREVKVIFTNILNTTVESLVSDQAVVVTEKSRISRGAKNPIAIICIKHLYKKNTKTAVNSDCIKRRLLQLHSEAPVCAKPHIRVEKAVNSDFTKPRCIILPQSRNQSCHSRHRPRVALWTNFKVDTQLKTDSGRYLKNYGYPELRSQLYWGRTWRVLLYVFLQIFSWQQCVCILII